MARSSKSPDYAKDPIIEPGTYTLYGNPEIERITVGHVRSWAVSAIVAEYGAPVEQARRVTRTYTRLGDAQQADRELAMGARQIKQEWDQVPVGRLPQ